jgi:hypothetical protein
MFDPGLSWCILDARIAGSAIGQVLHGNDTRSGVMIVKLFVATPACLSSVS